MNHIGTVGHNSKHIGLCEIYVSMFLCGSIYFNFNKSGWN